MALELFGESLGSATRKDAGNAAVGIRRVAAKPPATLLPLEVGMASDIDKSAAVEEWWGTFSSRSLSSMDAARQAFEAGMRAATPTRAEDLKPGDMFRKPNGKQVYVKLSQSTRHEVFGVNARGNTVTTRAIDEVVQVEDPQEWLNCKEE